MRMFPQQFLDEGRDGAFNRRGGGDTDHGHAVRFKLAAYRVQGEGLPHPDRPLDQGKARALGHLAQDVRQGCVGNCRNDRLSMM